MKICFHFLRAKLKPRDLSRFFGMKKYITIIKTYWQRALAYRFTVFVYRIGEVGEILVLILMWSAIYGGNKVIGGFTFQEMLTYILVGNFFNVMIRNWLENYIAGDIKDGRLSVFLIKPIAYFNYVLFREIGRISLAVLMSVLSQALVILFFFSKFIFNFDILYLLLIFLMIILAFITELLLSFLIGLIAFWTDEVDGVYRTIERLKKFFSGGFFPINLLPAAFVNISLFLPFAYSFFVPAQLYLKKIDLSAGLKGILVQIVWLFLLYGIIKAVWNRGLKRYEGVGI